MARLLVCLFVLTTLPSHSGAAQTPEYSGTIGASLKVRMTLEPGAGGTVAGSYHYVRVGKPIKLSGTREGRRLRLVERDASGAPAAELDGVFLSEDAIAGTWSSIDGSRVLPFVVRTTKGEAEYRAAKAKDRVSGVYEMNDGAREATLEVELLDAGHVRIKGDAFWIGNAETGNVNIGEVSGIVPLEGGRAVYADEGEYACRFVISFGAGSLSVAGDNGNCGGHNVSFDGRYRRQGRSR